MIFKNASMQLYRIKTALAKAVVFHIKYLELVKAVGTSEIGGTIQRISFKIGKLVNSAVFMTETMSIKKMINRADFRS